MQPDKKERSALRKLLLAGIAAMTMSLGTAGTAEAQQWRGDTSQRQMDMETWRYQTNRDAAIKEGRAKSAQCTARGFQDFNRQLNKNKNGRNRNNDGTLGKFFNIMGTMAKNDACHARARARVADRVGSIDERFDRHNGRGDGHEEMLVRDCQQLERQSIRRFGEYLPREHACNYILYGPGR